jgi:hypothetical protein
VSLQQDCPIQWLCGCHRTILFSHDQCSGHDCSFFSSILQFNIVMGNSGSAVNTNMPSVKEFIISETSSHQVGCLCEMRRTCPFIPSFLPTANVTHNSISFLQKGGCLFQDVLFVLQKDKATFFRYERCRCCRT